MDREINNRTSKAQHRRYPSLKPHIRIKIQKLPKDFFEQSSNKSTTTSSLSRNSFSREIIRPSTPFFGNNNSQTVSMNYQTNDRKLKYKRQWTE